MILYVVTALSYEECAHRYIVGEKEFSSEMKAHDFAKTVSNLISVNVEKACSDCHGLLSECNCE
jgi:hypothetical protein